MNPATISAIIAALIIWRAFAVIRRTQPQAPRPPQVQQEPGALTVYVPPPEPYQSEMAAPGYYDPLVKRRGREILRERGLL